MDVQEERYRKVMNDFRPILNNLICENPINPERRQQLPQIRNLKYITTKAILSDNYPFYSPIYE